jgi:peptidoglycan hydrolase-like protein with peptidoglycan-binding domain
VRRLANQVALALVAVLGLTSFAAAGATSKLPPTADCATVATGAHGPAVVTLQRAVKATADGDFGPMTAKAVATWQAKHKLKPTGAVDAATWKALPLAVSVAACGRPSAGKGVAASCTTLQVGAVGPAVGVLQSSLHITVDRAFGPLTRAAVVAAQRRLKLARTGVVDAATWAALGRTGTPACITGGSTVKVTQVTPGPTPAPTPAPPSPTALAQAKIRAQVVALAAKLPSLPGTTTDQVALEALHFAKAQTGKPYKWAGVGPAAYDCSGLVMTSYRNAGITTPRVAADQYGFGTSVPLNQVRQGDLLFYAMDLTKPATIYHVVMYVGAGKVIDAPYTGAFVGTRSLWTSNLLPVAWRPTGLLALPARPGTTGWTVSQLQAALNRGGAKLTVDGGYGPATAAAVKAWQTAHRLTVTGVTDLATWLTLR